MAKSTKSSSRVTKKPRKAAPLAQPVPPTEIPVLNPAVVAEMKDTVDRLWNTAKWMESTAKGIKDQLRSIEEWFMVHGPEVRLHGEEAAKGYHDFIAQLRKTIP